MSTSKVTPSGPLLRYAEGLRATLVEQGYAPNTVASHERLLITLSGWLQARHLAPEQLTGQMIGRFQRWRRSSSRRRLNPEHGLSALVAYLRSVEAIPTAQPSPADRVLTAYGDYLLVERRLAALTVVTRSDVIRRFLADRPARQDLDLAGLTVHDVHAFLLAEGTRLNVTSVGPVVDALRSFLRFLFATGVLAHDLSGTLPRVTTRRQAPLPRTVDAATVTTLLDSCDRSTAAGLRDYAILIVLVRLGLRANEVAAMRLEDFDWRAGELTVHGKGGRTDRMPLPTDVGRALAAYLRHGRAASPSRAVFLRVMPPAGALSRNGVVMVPRTASERAGIAVVGAHRLRHTSAARMLHAGASLREVGEVLRQERLQTTKVYASVDPASLHLLVRPWPGATR